MSLETAVAAPATTPEAAIESNIYDILGMGGEPEAAPPSNRDETGKFKKPDAPEPVAEEAPEAVEATAEDDEDYIEDVPEKEGEAPKRHKLSEVLQGFKKAQALEAELNEVKTRPIVVPEQFDQVIQQSVAAQQQMLARINQWKAVNEPQPPHPSYGNPNSPNYNPEAYARAMQNYHSDVERWNAVEQERQQIEHNANQQAQAVRIAQMQRNLAAIHEFWPEIKSEKAAQQVQADLVQHFGKYGMTKDLIAQIDHPAFYALAQVALKGLQSQATKEQVAKVVQAKPKLIKGQARQATPTNPNRAANFERLAKTGRAEDAYAIAETFF